MDRIPKVAPPIIVIPIMAGISRFEGWNEISNFFLSVSIRNTK
jgi:hypothetical protein